MAVAQAQHAVRELAKQLEKRNIDVLYAIHPVAGRMPGHMNVLLAEADVPYEQLKEMDDINPEFGRTDVAIVIGANDVTNPDARLKADSPIYGMPILNVDEAKQVIVLKRSMASGFAGIENPLFYNETPAGDSGLGPAPSAAPPERDSVIATAPMAWPAATPAGLDLPARGEHRLRRRPHASPQDERGLRAARLRPDRAAAMGERDPRCRWATNGSPRLQSS